MPIMENITPPKPAKRAPAALDLPTPAAGADVIAPKRISLKVRAIAQEAQPATDCCT
jgi:hypothetical protein